jgi:hypothetical protein
MVTIGAASGSAQIDAVPMEPGAGEVPVVLAADGMQ